LVAAACGTATPSATPVPSATDAPTSPPAATPSTSPTALPSGAVDAIFDQIEEQVLAIRGLKRTEVPRETIDEEALKAQTAKSFDEDNPPEYVAASERLLKGLGLIPAGESLADLYLELLTSQVAGFYRPDDDEMFVVADGGFGGAEKVFYAHEFTHALQDQHFDPWQDPDQYLDQTDRAIARAGLTEGDATLLMTLWAQGNLTPAEALQLLQLGLDPAAQEVLDRMPPILVEPLLFPYEAGLTLVSGLFRDGGWGLVDETYARPPDSTEQLLHPDRWASRQPPIVIATPANLESRMGTGWTIGLEDTLGELQLGIWLRTGRPAGDRTAAESAAAGWGGDRVILLDGPDDASAIALLTEWDSVVDAGEFAEQASKTRDAIGLRATIVHQPGSTTVRVLIGSDTAAAIRIDDVLGATGV
jgi:hypothetical protein